MAETWIEEGIQQGMQQGTQQGMQQGALEMAREAVLENLSVRFEVIPPSIVEAIKRIDDIARLKALLRAPSP